MGRLTALGLAGLLAAMPVLARAHAPAPKKESQQRGSAAADPAPAEDEPSGEDTVPAEEPATVEDAEEQVPVEDGAPARTTEPTPTEGGPTDGPAETTEPDKSAEPTEDEAPATDAETEPEGAPPPTAEPTTPRRPATGPRRGSGRLFDRSDDRLLFTAGAVSLGVGIAAVIPMTVGLVLGADADERLKFQNEPNTDSNNPGSLSTEDDNDRQRIFDFGETMNKMAIGSAVVAGVYIAGGFVMIGLAMRARKKNERRTALAPWGGRHGGGLVLRGRF